MLPPLPTWIKGYQRRFITGDLLAALMTTLLLVPQGLAYAALIGLPPQLGLYAALLPLAAYALFGSSMVLSVGPVAVISLMSAAALAPLATPGTAQYITGAIVLALISGTVLFASGLLRLGSLARFISQPVISGFITGAALLIVIGQLRPLLGIRAEGETAIELFAGLLASARDYHPLTAAIGIITLALLWLARRGLVRPLTSLGLGGDSAQLITRLMPTIVVLGAAALVALMGWQDKLAVVGPIPTGLPHLALPAPDFALLQALFLPALAIALISFIESVSIARKFAIRNRQRLDSNAELLGLGTANMVSGLCGAFPVAGGFARTAVNAEAGARTPLSGVFAAVFTALVLLFATGLFSTLPMAVLAATIIAAVVGLVDVKSLRHNWHYDRAEGLAQAGTALGVLVAGVEMGIGIGIGLSLAIMLWRASRPHIAIVGRVPGTEHFRNIARYQVETHCELLTIRIDENLFFANVDTVERFILRALEKQPQTRHLVLVMSSVNSIDTTALKMLDLLNERLLEQGRQLHLAEVKWPVLARLEGDGFPARLTGEIFLSTHAAYAALNNTVKGEGNT